MTTADVTSTPPTRVGRVKEIWNVAFSPGAMLETEDLRRPKSFTGWATLIGTMAELIALPRVTDRVVWLLMTPTGAVSG
ncbi:MAG: hypothetical protein BWY91_01237 [bacterium ADurb.BinA028]|nr:MAG: hypothetical protein BWY91_01237 [bacterium ADurb.BinA028]